MVNDIPYKVRRSAINRLCAQGSMSAIEAKVAHKTDVVRASVDFDRIVVNITIVVIVEVDIGMRPPRLSRERKAASLIDARSIPEILNTVVAYDVPLPCHRDPIVGAIGAVYFRGKAGQCIIRNKSLPNSPISTLWIESADEHVVSDVIVL